MADAMSSLDKRLHNIENENQHMKRSIQFLSEMMLQLSRDVNGVLHSVPQSNHNHGQNGPSSSSNVAAENSPAPHKLSVDTSFRRHAGSDLMTTTSESRLAERRQGVGNILTPPPLTAPSELAQFNKFDQTPRATLPPITTPPTMNSRKSLVLSGAPISYHGSSTATASQHFTGYSQSTITNQRFTQDGSNSSMGGSSRSGILSSGTIMTEATLIPQSPSTSTSFGSEVGVIIPKSTSDESRKPAATGIQRRHTFDRSEELITLSSRGMSQPNLVLSDDKNEMSLLSARERRFHKPNAGIIVNEAATDSFMETNISHLSLDGTIVERDEDTASGSISQCGSFSSFVGIQHHKEHIDEEEQEEDEDEGEEETKSTSKSPNNSDIGCDIDELPVGRKHSFDGGVIEHDTKSLRKDDKSDDDDCSDAVMIQI
eukprot:TRINITY_DN526371_c0_g3_i1.p1 TRINITY_DN526371_c0_g3~~TRINITY_DN526371_c0_g3_i1.p1  ORF type:complete len:503 (+),score=147.87 TRINITY_DN526371_c0_g3_i1:225-1511(+)